ncbi:MAG TPA: hypothetical protein VGO16_15075 [Pseudonocardiaceae bacterium]|nr:hypothetical protein [Pseudonocardiaceae bacterium]
MLIVVLIAGRRARTAVPDDTPAGARAVDIADQPGPAIATPSDACASVMPTEAQDEQCR